MTAAVELVPFGPEHFDQLIAWSPTPELLLQWAGPRLRHPLDHAQLTALMSEPAELFAVVEGGRVVGHAEIGRIDPGLRQGWLMRILVGDAADRGRGLGEVIVRLLLEVAFGRLGLERVYLNVLEDNTAALRLYRRLGFVPCAPLLDRPANVRCMVLERTS